MLRLVVGCVLAVALLPRAARAEEPARPSVDQPLARPGTSSRELEIEVPGERSRNNKLVVSGMLAAGALGGALGVYWHLDSRDAADAVSSDRFTGEAWTEAHAAEVDRAQRSKTRATVAYAVGGAFLLASVITYIVTEPESETTVIRTGVSVTPPARGNGAIVGKQWSF